MRECSGRQQGGDVGCACGTASGFAGEGPTPGFLGSVGGCVGLYSCREC